jgi:hypothetical protein
MVTRSRLLAATALIAVALASFFTGRNVEERALAAKALANARASTSPSPASQREPPSHRQLAVAEIVALPFADFYEALRSAPAEARRKWATELEAMPEGPRRTAAISGFYKLLVQFEPAAAAKAISEIEDKDLQNLALASAVDAAPGFAMRTMAELNLTLKDPFSRRENYFFEVLGEWLLIDAPAVVQFLDNHPDVDIDASLVPRELISTLATLDPEAAKEWMKKKGRCEVPENRRSFIEGWYENDRAAAVSYVVSRADDPEMRDVIGDVLRGLYYDSKEEARKFIESLPDDTRRHDAFRAAFEHSIFGDEEETGETRFTPRAVGEWMIEFPPAYWKGTMAEIFMYSRKPQEMLSWIEQQPLAIREALAAEYRPSYKASASDTIHHVLQVADPRLRDQLLRGLVNHLDATLGDIRTAISTAALSQEQKNHALQIVDAVAMESENAQGREK